ncbi:MAG: DUF4360 domain-containing protein [Bdellovibrionota bacterium]
MKFLLMMTICLFELNAALAQHLPPTAQLKNIRFAGPGCNPQSTSVTMTSDLSVLSVLYDKFSVEIGGNIPSKPRSAMKNCIILLDVEVPAGWQLRFDTVEYRGFINLPDNRTTATQLIAMEESGALGNIYQEHNITGPIVDSFSNFYSREQNNGKPVTSGTDRFGDRPFRHNQPFKCSSKPQIAYFRLRSKIILQSQNPSLSLAQFAIDSTDTTLKFHMDWTRCQ